MKKYLVNSKNLNNSLVFYRELFEKMPHLLSPSNILFETTQFQLQITESLKSNENEPYFLKANQIQLQDINHRMSRFQSIERLKNECEKLDKAIGLIDPDGQKWIVGEFDSNIHFEKCYTNETTIKHNNYGTI
ncbi:hypothetical protein [Ekhidna sp.]